MKRLHNKNIDYRTIKKVSFVISMINVYLHIEDLSIFLTKNLTKYDNNNVLSGNSCKSLV